MSQQARPQPEGAQSVSPTAAPPPPELQPQSSAPTTAPTQETSPWLISAGSVTGVEHVIGDLQGNGNQDSFGHREVRNDAGELLGIVAVTSDGCGSTPDSATGSRAAVRIVLNVVAELLREPKREPPQLAAELEVRLLDRIAKAASPLSRDGDVTPIIEDSYLFTLLCVIVTPFWTVIIGSGDGVIALNGQVQVLTPREGNRPEYISYRLMKPIPDGFENVHLQVHRIVDTKTVRSLLIATDGMGPATEGSLRGFRVEHLWEQARYRMSAQVQFTLTQLNRLTRKLNPEADGDGSIHVRLQEEEGVFVDDVAVVVFVRRDAAPLPESWQKVRGEWKYVPPPPPPPRPVVSAKPGVPPTAPKVVTPVPAPWRWYDWFLAVCTLSLWVFLREPVRQWLGIDTPKSVPTPKAKDKGKD